jgi:hypothetical protein
MEPNQRVPNEVNVPGRGAFIKVRKGMLAIFLYAKTSLFVLTLCRLICLLTDGQLS